MLWSFKADRVHSFNAHYHVDKDDWYPMKKENGKWLQGNLPIDSGQDYC